MTAEKPTIAPTARYSVGKAAKILGISRGTVYHYIRNGKIRIEVRKANGRVVLTGMTILQIWAENFRTI